MLKSFKKGKWDFNIKSIQKNYLTLNRWERYDPWSGDILFLVGGKSSYVQKYHYDDIYQQFPKAIIRVIDGVGHWIHNAEKNNEITSIINQFLLQ